MTRRHENDRRRPAGELSGANESMMADASIIARVSDTFTPLTEAELAALMDPRLAAAERDDVRAARAEVAG